MSEFGIKIKNYEAGSLHEVTLGTRNKYDTTPAMLTNSLFLDFLKENGLQIVNGKTRDVICIEFNYGTRSYEEEVKLYKTKLKNLKKDEQVSEEDRIRLTSWYETSLERAEENKDKYQKNSPEELRVLFYNEGVDIFYPVYGKGKEKETIINKEAIHYRMLFRTPGKAKKGSCMFIRQELYDIARNFLYMGIQLTEKNPAIVEIGAYSSLITSSIVGKIRIEPEQIFVIKDIDSFFQTDVVCVETDEYKHCMAKHRSDYTICNTMFDGQALIDYSIFPDWGDGYVLLRHHMCKAAAFATNIELFMRERFGDQYDTATLTDMYGIEHKVSNIKLITTDNMMKWKTFGVSFEYWSEWVRKNDCQFGVVKTAHKSKLGAVQRMSYQMINALDMSIMPSVIQTSSDYVNLLKTDDMEFCRYLRKNSNFSNDYEVLAALVDHNSDFVRSDYFRDRRKTVIKMYTNDMKTGKVIQNADNLVIVGSPYAMLLAAVGEDVEKDPTFEVEDNCIQCWTERFADREYLASFRNPFNSKNNMGYLHNMYHSYFDRYFRLGEMCIAVNMQHTDFQWRNNGLIYGSLLQ